MGCAWCNRCPTRRRNGWRAKLNSKNSVVLSTTLHGHFPDQPPPACTPPRPTTTCTTLLLWTRDRSCPSSTSRSLRRLFPRKRMRAAAAAARSAELAVPSAIAWSTWNTLLLSANPTDVAPGCPLSLSRRQCQPQNSQLQSKLHHTPHTLQSAPIAHRSLLRLSPLTRVVLVATATWTRLTLSLTGSSAT